MTRRATNSKSAAANSRSLRSNAASAKNPKMSDPTAVPKILQRPYRVRYLKLIAVFKILKGLFLLSLGISLIFLNSRTRWTDAISDWADDELLVVHSKTLHYLLNQLQNALLAGHLRATGLLALFYSAVLFTEGTGVYLQQRWAELLMIFATAALIPFEIHHLSVRPSLGAAVILGVNCFIVWFLYLVLRRKPNHSSAPVEREVAEIK
jgi:uncharacterized membrane protein (DUF2068 family)